MKSRGNHSIQVPHSSLKVKLKHISYHFCPNEKGSTRIMCAREAINSACGQWVCVWQVALEVCVSVCILYMHCISHSMAAGWEKKGVITWQAGSLWFILVPLFQSLLLMTCICILYNATKRCKPYTFLSRPHSHYAHRHRKVEYKLFDLCGYRKKNYMENSTRH